MPPPSGSQPQTATIGTSTNYWLYSSATGFDLTRPTTSDSHPANPNITIKTASEPITLDPSKTALLVIDMQNFFLSSAFGRNTSGAGHKALARLRDSAIPAARKAGVRVVWVNWGLTQEEVDEMPPGVKKAFGFEVRVGEGEGVVKDGGKGEGEDAVFGDRGGDVEGEVFVWRGKDPKVYRGLGSDCGKVRPLGGEGEEVDAGRLLMRGQWNSGLHAPLDRMYEEGRVLDTRPDVWIHKNRMSALWGSGTDLEKYLLAEGITTLLFSGVNTDQCVGGTLQDAFSKGYDCVLLSDAAGTSSPDSAQESIEYNASKSWGFAATCDAFERGVSEMASQG